MPKQQGYGWTILAAALTNTPRARQKNNPISIVERDGAKFLRVPLIRKCKIRYQGSVITFNQKKFDQMLENHKNQVWDAPPYVRVGHKDSPGLSWFAQVQDESPHGEMIQEGDWLVAYALPTDEEVKKAERGYKFASIDMHPDYMSNQMELAFNSQDFEEVTKEEPMTIAEGTKDGDKIELSKEEYQDLLSQSASNEVAVKLQAQVDALAAEKATLETEKVKFKAERIEDRKMIYMSSVDAVIEKAKARTSEDGKTALPAFVINTLESLLKFETIDSTIKLSTDGDGVSGYVDYVFSSVKHLLEGIPILAMPIEGSTTGEDGGPESEKILFGMTTTELDEFYTKEAENAWPGGTQ